jgi:ADP-dependent NAD(P)H-hydrate dehydratase / NAD(P)H-hydrate epimerase
MQRVLPPCDVIALHDIATTRSIEQRAQALLAPHTLMQRAGHAVARLALAVAPHARRIWIAAGPGNNGGDGFEAALQLQRAGKRVVVSAFADADRQPADARDAMQRARAEGLSVRADADIDFVADLAIDALLGIGGRRAPAGPVAAAVRRLNELSCPVLAIDVPTGLNADTGAALGSDCVVATHTLSLLTLKPGLFTGVGRDHAGVVWLDSLEVPCDAAPTAWLNGVNALPELAPARAHAQHKGSFGDVAIVGGSSGMTGAAWLAARAALAAGAGRVYVDLLDATARSLDAQRPELMLRTGWAGGRPEVLGASLVVCGCGGGDAVRAVLPKLLSLVPRLVLDADALNALAADATLRQLLTTRAARGHATVLTPHPLEAARLLGSGAAQVQADRLGAARRLAEELRCIVVLKGSGTVIAAPQRAPYLNATGSARLATAGTGDVLAGWLGGWWSQVRGPGSDAAALDAARSTVFLHGQAADSGSDGPLRAADLVEEMYRLRSVVGTVRRRR